MQVDEKHTLWRTSASLIGAAMPTILIGRAVFAIVLALGIIVAMFATKGDSLRSSVRMLKSSKIVRLVILLLVALLASSALSVNMMHSLTATAGVAAVSFAGMLLFIVMREMPGRHVQGALQSLCISLLVVMCLAVADAYFNDPRLASALHGDNGESAHRLNYMSSVIAVLAPFMWAWLLQKYREHAVLARWFALPLSIFSFWAVFICGGRAGWIAVTVSAVLFLMVSGKRKDIVLHTKHWLLLLLVTIFGPIAYGLTRGKDFLMERLGLTGEGQFTLLSLDTGHIGIWEYAVKNMMANPLTGTGVHTFRFLEKPEVAIASTAHPHNFVVQLLLETGLIGLAVAAMIVVYLFKKMSVMAQHNLLGLAGLCAVTSFFVASLTNMSIFEPWWISFLVFSGIFAARIGWVEKPKSGK